jgi:hypothetical protein
MQLNDGRLQNSRRQALAAQVGRIQGNQHLQSLVVALKRDGKKEDPSSPRLRHEGIRAVPNLSVSQPQAARLVRGDEEKQEDQTKKQEKRKEEEKERDDRVILKATLKKVDEMIRTARQVPGGQYAAENLEYWKSKKGGTRKIPAAAFEQEAFIVEWLRGKPRTKFLEGAERRLKSGELAAGKTVKMHWTDSVYAPEGTPLFYALGGFTIRSDAVVRAARFPGDVSGHLVSFESWTCQAFDEYNWDKLKSTVIPMFGEISDDELRVLEKYGYGKSFKVESVPWTVTDSQCLQEVAIE